MSKLNEKGSVTEPQIEQMAWNFSFEEFFFSFILITYLFWPQKVIGLYRGHMKTMT